MGSSKQLAEDLKMKLIDAYKSGEGFKRITKHFYLAIFTVCHLEMASKGNCGRQGNIWKTDRAADMLSERQKKKPSYDNRRPAGRFS